MHYETIECTKAGPACIIALHRPERRNALSLACMSEIAAGARAVEADATVRAVVITGGADYFSSGADLQEVLAVSGPAACAELFRNFHRLADTLETLSKPVIAAIEGFCLTGGLELALACDIRVGARGSTYGITSARIGTVAGAGGTQRLPRLIGPGRALDLLFAAEPICAEEAHRIGLIERLTEKGAALQEAQRMIEVYSKRAPLSLAFLKRAVHRGLQMDLASGIELETYLATAIYGSRDRTEGISAVLEKRSPNFEGR